jgi:hypothetical protein
MAAILGFSLDSINGGHLFCRLHLEVAQWKQQFTDGSRMDSS